MRMRTAQIGADIAKLGVAVQRQVITGAARLRSAEIADGTTRRDHLRGGNNGIGI
jgi:hypothetical protein